MVPATFKLKELVLSFDYGVLVDALFQVAQVLATSIAGVHLA
jgi:hypothetical protein